MASVRCAECKREVPAEEPGAERLPCPYCRSLARIHETSATVTARANASASASVERGVNEMRIGALALLLGVALAIGLAAGAAWGVVAGVLAGVAAALVTAALLALVYRVPLVRHLVMEAMHRITGQ